MKMAATWIRAERGLAIGAIVHALTCRQGDALSTGRRRSPAIPRGCGGPIGVAAVLAAALIAGWFRGVLPYGFPARPFSWGLIAVVVREPALRRVTGGYLGHMWELYAFWAWSSRHFTASFAARSGLAATSGAWPFACVRRSAQSACVWGGRAADRMCRVPVVRAALMVSGACCVLSALAFGGPRWLVLAICLIWVIAVIADSAQFSAMVTEMAPPHAVGTALTLQTSLGFTNAHRSKHSRWCRFSPLAVWLALGAGGAVAGAGGGSVECGARRLAGSRSSRLKPRLRLVSLKRQSTLTQETSKSLLTRLATLRSGD